MPKNIDEKANLLIKSTQNQKECSFGIPGEEFGDKFNLNQIHSQQQEIIFAQEKQSK
ncbi:MAG: hypothetical protein V4561_09230 [Bacteroidota bacterium]